MWQYPRTSLNCFDSKKSCINKVQTGILLDKITSLIAGLLKLTAVFLVLYPLSHSKDREAGVGVRTCRKGTYNWLCFVGPGGHWRGCLLFLFFRSMGGLFHLLLSKAKNEHQLRRLGGQQIAKIYCKIQELASFVINYYLIKKKSQYFALKFVYFSVSLYTFTEGAYIFVGLKFRCF